MSKNTVYVKNEESEMGVTASKEDLSYEQLFAETKKILIENSEESILSEIENQREEFATYEQLVEEEREESSSLENEDNVAAIDNHEDVDESYAKLLEDDVEYTAATPSETKTEDESEEGREEPGTGIESTKAYSPDEGDTQDTSVDSDEKEAKKEIKSASSLGMNPSVAELPLEDSITYERIVEEEGKVKQSPSIEAMLERQKSKQVSSYEDLSEEAQGIASENAVLEVQSDDSISYEELVGDFLGPTSRNTYEITNEEKPVVVSEAKNVRADPVVGSCGCGDCVIS
ncbi:predicted protein [Chaetoceros tenuissimus]|uniref:Uncharacterized protein n=1 Tax=Chaetoceros tenuissimus TaxID=426638 RepID=A0AAD3H700_9STRA|nr:predicted protein [Chaetoceros tenuissimus]